MGFILNERGTNGRGADLRGISVKASEDGTDVPPAQRVWIHPLGSSIREKVNNLRALLMNRNFPQQAINLCIAQIALETGSLEFDSMVARADNNLSGITYNNKLTTATVGLARPKKEGRNYAHFQTLEDWADVYKTTLSKGAQPIQATSIEDFANRLKINGYFTANLNDYLNGINRWYNSIQRL